MTHYRRTNPRHPTSHLSSVQLKGLPASQDVTFEPVVHPDARDAVAHELRTRFRPALPLPHLLSGIGLAGDEFETGVVGTCQ